MRSVRRGGGRDPTASPIPAGSCCTFGVNGTLYWDPTTGVALELDSGRSTAVMFPVGWSARHVDGIVAVLNEQGQTVAVTGQDRYFEGGYVDGGFFVCG